MIRKALFVLMLIPACLYGQHKNRPPKYIPYRSPLVEGITLGFEFGSSGIAIMPISYAKGRFLIVGELGRTTITDPNTMRTESGCADGTNSSSIGSRGACSWHGGVETYTVYGTTYRPFTYGINANMMINRHTSVGIGMMHRNINSYDVWAKNELTIVRYVSIKYIGAYGGLMGWVNIRVNLNAPNTEEVGGFHHSPNIAITFAALIGKSDSHITFARR